MKIKARANRGGGAEAQAGADAVRDGRQLMQQDDALMPSGWRLDFGRLSHRERFCLAMMRAAMVDEDFSRWPVRTPLVKGVHAPRR